MVFLFNLLRGILERSCVSCTGNSEESHRFDNNASSDAHDDCIANHWVGDRATHPHDLEDEAAPGWIWTMIWLMSAGAESGGDGSVVVQQGWPRLLAAY